MTEQGPHADFIEQKDALILQRRFGIAQGLSDIGRRMKNISGDDKVVLAFSDLL
jgi:hypothetical protein